MGLLDNPGIAKVKRLFDANKGKIADGVGKATDLIDDKTGGKYRDKLDKLDNAANKLVNDDEDTAAAATTTTAAGATDQGSAPTDPGASPQGDTGSTTADGR